MKPGAAFATRQTRARVMLDLIRLQNAPISQDEAADKLLDDIKAEVAKLGLSESDAVWFYRKMQRDGWKFGGVPITNWRWTVQNWAGHKFLPSQR
jgi:hypothetical protein